MADQICAQLGLGFEQVLGHGEVGQISTPFLSLSRSLSVSTLALLTTSGLGAQTTAPTGQV